MKFQTTTQYQNFVQWGLRLALASAFLSAVADRFGIWGVPGEKLVAWGNFQNFISYTGHLNPWLPKSLVPVMAWAATILEILFAIFLIVNIRIVVIAFLSGVLLLLFALAMSWTDGLKSPLNFSVFSASFASFGLSLLILLKKERNGNWK